MCCLSTHSQLLKTEVFITCNICGQSSPPTLPTSQQARWEVGLVLCVPAASVWLCLRSKTCTNFDRVKESKMQWPMPENSGAAGSSAVSLQLQGVVAPPLFHNTLGYNPPPCWEFSVQKLPRLLIFWPYSQVR